MSDRDYRRVGRGMRNMTWLASKLRHDGDKRRAAPLDDRSQSEGRAAEAAQGWL